MNNNTMNDTINGASKVGGVASDVAHKLGKELKNGVHDIGCAIREAGTTVGHDVSALAEDTYGSIVQSGREGAKQLQSQVQSSPLLALGLAFGAGLLASSFWARR
jgi:hypothetical protein